MKTEDIHNVISDLNRTIRQERLVAGIECSNYLAVLPRIERLYGATKKVSLTLIYNGSPVLYTHIIDRIADDDYKEECISRCISDFMQKLFALLIETPAVMREIINDNVTVKDGIG